MNARTRSLLRLAVLAAPLAAPSLLAGIPEPDTVLFGSIALDGQYVTALDTSVTIELHGSTNAPPLQVYRMGASARAGNLYVLRAMVESGAPVLQPGALVLGSTVQLVVRDASGVRDSKSVLLDGRGGFIRMDFGDVDGDGDGMSDAFETTYFGNATAGDPGLDSDLDGRSNLREFLDHTNPLIADGRHPADLNPADNAIRIGEVTAYTLAWQLGEEWPIEPKVIPVDYVTRAGALWKGGETYVFDNDPPTTAPLWWVNPPPSGPALQGKPPTDSSSAGSSPRSAGLQAGPDTAPTSDASRSAPTNFKPALATPVRIRIRPATGTLSYAVEEAPPGAWIIRNVSHGGRVDRVHGKIKWGPFYDTEPRELTYEITPLPNASAAGSFTGLASFNGRSVSLAGVQQVLPPGVAASPTLTRVSAANGQVLLQLGGSPGSRYILEASSDLREWSPIQTVTADDRGSVNHAVSQLGLAHRFFRARSAD